MEWHNRPDLDVLGETSSRATRINNSGQIVGYVATTANANTEWRATLWNGTSVTDLGTFGGRWSEANAINNFGQIVGDSEANSYYDARATLWNGTSTIDLNTFLSPDEIQAGWVLVLANDINDKGTIVGTAMNSKTGIYRGFVLSVPEPETYTMLLVGLGFLKFALRRKNQKSS